MHHVLIPSFLGEEVRAGLLAYAIEARARFTSSGVGTGNAVATKIRNSHKLEDLGPFRDVIEEKARERLPAVAAQLGIPAFPACEVQLELVSHGDGAYYRRHVDLYTGSAREGLGGDRLISMVYYFHRRPRKFSGGQLRLYPVGRDAGQVIDVEPSDETAVAFGSWVPHEVLPVGCPGAAFDDSRFSVNCWFLRKS